MTGLRRMVLVALKDRPLSARVARLLEKEGYGVREATTGAAARALASQLPVSCAVVGSLLADTAGVDLVSALLADHPQIPVIVAEGQPDVRTVAECMARGAAEYLPGPLDPAALVCTLSRLIRERSAPRSTRVAKPQAPSLAHAGEPGAGDSFERAAAALDALVHTMEAKDPHLVGHSIRVAELAASIAARMGRTDAEVEEVRLAGRFHDIGMIAIEGQFLTKPGPLTPEEFSEVRRHPALGYQLLAAYPQTGRAAGHVRGHHERWDGAGYPDRLAGHAIPWGARILAVAEVFDALTNSRSYHSPISARIALEQVQCLSGTALDPAVTRALQAVLGHRQSLEFIRDDDEAPLERSLLAAGTDAPANPIESP
jgi:cyclic di-GMP phosphodiesterase